MASPPSSSKMHASPSKGPTPSAALTSANRTYDAKLVQREMLRLGTLAGQLPAAAFNTIAGTTAAALNSASTLVLPSAGVAPPGAAGSTHGHAHTLGHALGHGHGGTSNIGNAMGGSDAWAQLHVHVLPLFNHEQLQFPIEDLNLLVRRHIEAVTSAGPARALSTLEVDIAELIGAGMTTLNTKLSGVDDDKLPARVVELWTFFWDQVLPYVEGVFIPLQTHPLLLALHRTPKSHRPASPTTLTSPDDPSSGAPGTTLSPIDVRTIALRAFRDKIIVPVASRLETRLIAMRPGSSFSSSSTSVVPGMNMNNGTAETTTYQHPRLQQMLLVLHSQAQRSRVALSINCPTPQLSPQELVIRRLLDALQSHRAALSGTGSSLNGKSSGPLSPPRHRRAPSFLSGGAPRDRRGRVGIGLNAGADSDKENAKRRGRYIDDSIYPTPGPSGSVNTAPSSYTIGENSSGINKHRFGRYVSSDWDEDGDWEMGMGMGHRGTPGSGSWDGGTGGGTTPRGRFSAERERDRTFLESLRSPNPVDHDQPSSFASLVQNGIGNGMESNGGANVTPVVPGKREDSLPVPRPAAREDVFSSASQIHTVNGNGHGHTNSGDNHLDWDSAQAVVERMIGLNASARSESPSHAHGHLHSHTPSPAPAPALPAPAPALPAPAPPSTGPPSLVHTPGPGQGPGSPPADPRRRRMT